MNLRFVWALLLCISGGIALGQADATAPTGTWRGDSICQVRPSPCNDEKALYHVKALENKTDEFAITFSKIVDGHEVVMGTIEDCHFNRGARTIRCDYERGTWLLTIRGAEMQGTLTLTDGRVFRKVTLRKQ